jgi:4-carboxymuconolactone decarboxylase
MASSEPLPPGRALLAEMAPKLSELTEEVLYGDVWERPGLSKRDRSLITVAALMAMYRLEQLPLHVRRALRNGVTRDELLELITHLAFYSGWPTSVSAVGIAKRIFEEEGV